MAEDLSPDLVGILLAVLDEEPHAQAVLSDWLEETSHPLATRTRTKRSRALDPLELVLPLLPRPLLVDIAYSFVVRLLLRVDRAEPPLSFFPSANLELAEAQRRERAENHPVLEAVRTWRRTGTPTEDLVEASRWRADPRRDPGPQDYGRRALLWLARAAVGPERSAGAAVVALAQAARFARIGGREHRSLPNGVAEVMADEERWQRQEVARRLAAHAR